MTAGMELPAMVAVRSEEVSKTCGVWFGPGILCTRVPAGIGTVAGEPGAEPSVNASTVDALTPGEGVYPTSRASSKTLRSSTAVSR